MDRAVRVDGLNPDRDARVRSVVRSGHPAASRIEELLAVIDGAVRQHAGGGLARAGFAHTQSPVEIPHGDAFCIPRPRF